MHQRQTGQTHSHRADAELPEAKERAESRAAARPVRYLIAVVAVVLVLGVTELLKGRIRQSLQQNPGYWSASLSAQCTTRLATAGLHYGGGYDPRSSLTWQGRKRRDIYAAMALDLQQHGLHLGGVITQGLSQSDLFEVKNINGVLEVVPLLHHLQASYSGISDPHVSQPPGVGQHRKLQVASNPTASTQLHHPNTSSTGSPQTRVLTGGNPQLHTPLGNKMVVTHQQKFSSSSPGSHAILTWAHMIPHSLLHIVHHMFRSWRKLLLFRQNNRVPQSKVMGRFTEGRSEGAGSATVNDGRRLLDAEAAQKVAELMRKDHPAGLVPTTPLVLDAGVDSRSTLAEHGLPHGSPHGSHEGLHSQQHTSSAVSNEQQGSQWSALWKWAGSRLGVQGHQGPGSGVGGRRAVVRIAAQERHWDKVQGVRRLDTGQGVDGWHANHTEIPVRAVVMPITQPKAAMQIWNALRKHVMNIVPESELWMQDLGIYHATIFHASSHQMPVPASDADIAAEVAAVRRVAEHSCPFTAVIDRVVVTSTGVVVACWQVVPGGCEPATLRHDLRTALPKAPSIEGQMVKAETILHTTLARILAPMNAEQNVLGQVTTTLASRLATELTEELCGLPVVFSELWYVQEKDLLALALQGEYSHEVAPMKCVKRKR